jgi:gallate decarboxylase subunit D
MNGGWSIFAEGSRLGKDFLFTVTGGEAHIGAVSTAYLADGEWVVETQELPGHKEGPLSAMLALAGARALNATVTVVAGIHIQHASKEDIAQAVEQSEVRFKEELRRFIG